MFKDPINLKKYNKCFKRSILLVTALKLLKALKLSKH